jgi:membrane fusion protein (multidrug efflux system)
VAAGAEIDVKSRTAGEVLRVHADIGDTVKQGQLLAELDPADAQNQIARAQATLAASQARLKQARESLSIAELCLDAQRGRADAGIRAATARAQRARSRADRMKATLSKVTSQEQYDEAEAAAVEAAANLDLSKVQLKDVKTQELSLDLRRDDVACAEAMVNIDQLALIEAQQRLADKKILAPIDGTVSACLVHPGQFVAAGLPSAETRLLTISNVSRLYVVASPGACQVRKIKPGQQATILSDAAPGERFSGCVVRATPCAKDSSATVKIEITSANRALLVPDMPVTVELGD